MLSRSFLLTAVALACSAGLGWSEDDAAEDTVLLGSAELTAGISGRGPAGVDELKRWLADARNHKPLKVQLPEGLAAGRGMITGLDKNPLTRAKIELGRQLYFDKRLSSDDTVSCASCHDPRQGFTVQARFGAGVKRQLTSRSPPVTFNRIFSAAQFWDGRAASLEEQAKGPITNPREMGHKTHEPAVAKIMSIEGYRLQFQAVFGQDVSIDNIGRALATFERVLVTGPSAFDYSEWLNYLRRSYPDELKDAASLAKADPELAKRYRALVAGAKKRPMSAGARRGRDLFWRPGGCKTCHIGTNLTDEKYHNIGVGMDRDDPDLGRFNVTGQDKDRGAFKTPTLRNVALTAPYMHDGSLATLKDVVEWYDKGGHPNPQLSGKIKKLNLTARDKADLVAFLKACTGSLPKVQAKRLPK